MEIKAGVLDRIGQSFTLFKDNFIGLFLPFFLYNFISVVIVGTISQYYMINSFAGIDNMQGLDLFEFLNNSAVVIGISIGTMLYVAYLILYIVVLLGFLRSLKQIIDGNKISIFENLKYGVENFSNSMKTYWYIFSYVALIPSLLFIAGGILFSLSLYIPGLDSLKSIGGSLIGISLLIFIFFAIYRGLKSKFALYSAVNEDIFTKENFNFSIKSTDLNWWRIFGNFFLLGILIGIISSITSSIIGTVSFISNGGGSMIDSLISSIYKGGTIGTPNMGDVKNIIDGYVSNFSIFGELISNFVKNILATIFSVYLLIFTYIFFLRLKQESNKNTEEIKLKNKELNFENIEL